MSTWRRSWALPRASRSRAARASKVVYHGRIDRPGRHWFGGVLRHFRLQPTYCHQVGHDGGQFVPGFWRTQRAIGAHHIPGGDAIHVVCQDVPSDPLCVCGLCGGEHYGVCAPQMGQHYVVHEVGDPPRRRFRHDIKMRALRASSASVGNLDQMEGQTQPGEQSGPLTKCRAQPWRRIGQVGPGTRECVDVLPMLVSLLIQCYSAVFTTADRSAGMYCCQLREQLLVTL